MLFFFRKERVLVKAFLTMADGMRPFRCRIAAEGIDWHMQPKDVMRRVADAKQVVLSLDPPTLEARDGLEVLFSGSSPIWARPCRFCLLRGSVRFPKRAVKCGIESICIDCAKAQFVKEAQSKGWKASDSMVRHLGRILQSAGDYDLAWRTISPDYDPDRDWSRSLYDVIETRASKRESMNVPELIHLYDHRDHSEKFVRRLEKLGVKSLLPVQVSAVKAGLVRGENLLVVSSTSSGKTLIAEIAGIPRALDGRKFLYLVPLVALANLRYSEFDHKYRSLGLRTAIRVGVGRIRTGPKMELNTDIEKSDIIVGSYEGMEQVLRSGNAKRLGDLGAVAIDEVQNVADEDRGARLDGLIKKLKVISPQAQFLYLSATVGNPSDLASRLRASLVLCDERPVPLERHLISISSPAQKLRLMIKLIRREFSTVSKEGYRGQTLIFTNSRRKCHQLASAISSPSCPTKAYHSGLSYERRSALETQFMRQEIAAVVTTAALAAGVDLPASQVIFETLAMGTEWITPTEFHQMLGRAGRLGFHDSGKAVILMEPGRTFSRAERMTEDEVALDLLNSRIEDVRPVYSHDDLNEQVLADISTFGMLRPEELDTIQRRSLGFTSDIRSVVTPLVRDGMVSRRSGFYAITPVGRIVSSYFLSPEQSSLMIKAARRGLSPLEAIVSASVFDRAYLSERLQKQIESSSRKHISVRFFDSDVLDLLSRPRKVSGEWFKGVIGRITVDLLRCRCKSSPHCSCPPLQLSKTIIELRLSGRDPDGISAEIYRLYGIEAYPGDLLEYLNDATRLAEALSKLAEVINRPRTAQQAQQLCESIMG